MRVTNLHNGNQPIELETSWRRNDAIAASYLESFGYRLVCRMSKVPTGNDFGFPTGASSGPPHE